MIEANIIADSLSPQRHRLTTYILKFPRIVLAEFNTHRMLSRNSASSRAIPFKKMLEMVQTDPFIPIRWMKDHSGMQGNEYFTDDEVEQLCLLEDHLTARDHAAAIAKRQSDKGLTKQMVNRYLEPFMWHTVIATATEWENFFALRAHEAAEIHIQELANKMLEVYNQSSPKQLQAGDWHIPFGDQIDGKKLDTFMWKSTNHGYETYKEFHDFTSEAQVAAYKVKIATARCARVSYNNFEGKDDYEADIKLHDRLAASGHWSPFEHCAKVMTEADYYNDYRKVEYQIPVSQEPGWCGNFRGFIQYRKMFPNENRTDSRVRRTTA